VYLDGTEWGTSEGPGLEADGGVALADDIGGAAVVEVRRGPAVAHGRSGVS